MTIFSSYQKWINNDIVRLNHSIRIRESKNT